ncbi:MAG: DUF6273 domain-containing protein [Treponema sp.]|nr:DUF6273 domain-containing protein [Treponema sp.]
MKKIKNITSVLFCLLFSYSILSCNHGQINEIEEENIDYQITYSFHEQPEKIGTQIIKDKEYDILVFGDYPQSKKDNSVKVNKIPALSMGHITYYAGSDGNYYAKLDNEFFLVEPLKWRVLTKDYNESGKMLLLSESIIDSGVPFHDEFIDTDLMRPRNKYFISRMRDYLSGTIDDIKYGETSGMSRVLWNGKGLFQTAFTPAGQKFLVSVNKYPEASIDDIKGIAAYEQYSGEEVFLLSVKESVNPDYGFPAYDWYKNNPNKEKEDDTRIRFPTDYAIAKGAKSSDVEGQGGYWWLRSPNYYNGDEVRCVDDSGFSYSIAHVHDTSMGIVPAITIENY